MEKITCALVTNGLAVYPNGSLGPCCNWRRNEPELVGWLDYQKYNDVVRSNLLDQMNNGQWPAGCVKCENEERINIRSLRRIANELYPKPDITASVDNPILDLELTMSTHCNLRCIMCGPYASTSWVQEIAEHAEQFKRIPHAQPMVEWLEPEAWYDQPEFYDFLRKILAHVNRIDISGGEPLTGPRTGDVLDILIELGKTDVWLQFCSNMTKIPNRILEKLSKFTNLRMSLSLEGVGEQNDYLRYPSRWQDIQDNVDLLIGMFDRHPIPVVHTVLQHTSVYTIPALAEFCRTRDIRLTYTMVQGHHDSLHIDGAPPQDVKKLIDWAHQADWLRPNERDPILNLASIPFNREHYDKFRQYVETLDHIRGTNYDQIFMPSKI